MDPIKTAVIGVGYLGQYHAQKYAQSELSTLVAVCDNCLERAQEIAKRQQTEAIEDYHSLVGRVQAVSIATPTPSHYKIGQFFLENGVHVLLEKPIATTVAEANDLIDTAAKHQALLQIGHLERFNNAVKAVAPYLSQPRFIESLRTASFQPRGTDVNVILDLMIHDIDIIQSIIQAEITHISASGASVFSPFIDLANARIEFDNGCVANVTANRVSLKTERRLRIFQEDSYLNIDLNHKILNYYTKGAASSTPGIPEIDRSNIRFDKGDALKDQINAFLTAIINQEPVLVSGLDGKRALETAINITGIVHANNQQFPLQKEVPIES